MSQNVENTGHWVRESGGAGACQCPFLTWVLLIWVKAFLLFCILLRVFPWSVSLPFFLLHVHIFVFSLAVLPRKQTNLEAMWSFHLIPCFQPFQTQIFFLALTLEISHYRDVGLWLKPKEKKWGLFSNRDSCYRNPSLSVCDQVFTLLHCHLS